MAYHVKKMACFRGPNLDGEIIGTANDPPLVKLKAGHDTVGVTREVPLDCGRAPFHPLQVDPVLSLEELLPRKAKLVVPVPWIVKVIPVRKHPPDLVI